MVEILGAVVDNSYSFPGAQAIASAGYLGCIRYLSTNPRDARLLTRAQMDSCHQSGLSCGIVWETSADRARAGWGAGQSDAVAANHVADTLRWPSERPIYYAVDFDAVGPMVRPYFDGVKSVHAGGSRPWGVYGCYSIAESIGADTFFVWQCAAWSGNGAGTGGSIQGRRVSGHACLFQRVGYVLNNTSDHNDVLKPDWGGWHPDHGYALTAINTEEQELMSIKDELWTKLDWQFAALADQVEKVRGDILGADAQNAENVAAVVRGESLEGVRGVLQGLAGAGVISGDVEAAARAVAEHLTVTVKDAR